jgi:hypothetical protein
MGSAAPLARGNTVDRGGYIVFRRWSYNKPETPLSSCQPTISAFVTFFRVECLPYQECATGSSRPQQWDRWRYWGGDPAPLRASKLETSWGWELLSELRDKCCWSQFVEAQSSTRRVRIGSGKSRREPLQGVPEFGLDTGGPG